MSRLTSLCGKLPLSLFLFLVLTLVPFPVISQSPSSADREVLLDLKRRWGNPPWLGSWNSTSSPCDWPEIQCTAGAVTGVILRNINITENIPPAICNLKNLTVLDLSYNYFNGNFPKFLYNCSNLEYLDLSENYFVGPIPSDIDRMSTLTYLDLNENNFSGPIPPAIGRLPQLKTLNLYVNLFNGTIPAAIGNLSSLEYLRMAYNEFSYATIPPEFGKLSKLKYLWMSTANLVGEIPESFANLSSLERLILSSNNLEGPLPPGLFRLKNLIAVDLQKNQISGEIPTPIESLKLKEIDLSENELIGSIPEDIGKLQSLELLHLFVNRLSGEVPARIGQISTLTDFKVFINALNGTLPPEFGLHSKLEFFEVCDNNFTGNLPENLCAGGALAGLVAFSNNLFGEVPKSLGNCGTLRTVQLHRNNFHGEVPLGLWTSPEMLSLMLSDNSFSGELPAKLAWNLSRLEISNNKFSGQIPTGIASWTRLVAFEASNNQFSGEIPVELTSLPQLITLLLDGNSLSGQFPSTIISWKSLNTLNLARNKLHGQIPPALGSLPTLVNLDLSENQFSGEIPPELGHLRLTNLNLSSNHLTGKIPNEFDNLAYQNSFSNNPKLCAVNNPISNLQKCVKQSQDSNSLSPRILAAILVFAAVLFLVTALITFFVVKGYQRKKLKKYLAGWILTSFQKLEFSKANILLSLTANNVIGSGGSGTVYRIPILNNSGNPFVAVKRIWNNNTEIDDRAEKEFHAELEILGSIRHANIVKLLCSISREDSKLLVYEYLENQSLDKWLHRKQRKSGANNLSSSVAAGGLSKIKSIHHVVLDWPMRMKIAVGAAQGLFYMHHDCSPPVIHRDVKSSNILLDAEFKPKIADFGLAKLLAKPGDLHTMSVVAGSFGYLPPEYAYTTKVNEKIDVYSFGVVLLELVTGREAGEGDENTSLAEWAWRRHGGGSPIAEAVDEDVKEPCYLEEMSTVFQLGLVCTSTLPSDRPSMKEVLQILRRCCCGRLLLEEGKKMGKIDQHDVVSPHLGGANKLPSQKQSTKVSEEDEDDIICRV